jgi:uncharacterized protein
LEILSKGESISENKIDRRFIDCGICEKKHINEEAIIHEMIASNLTNNNSSLRLIVLPTRECNFRCIYCYEEKRNENMSEKTIKNLINATKQYLREHPAIKMLEVEWFGGEPLLQYDTIIMIAENLYNFCKELNVLFWMSMTTNGYLLSEKYAQKLLALNLWQYQITIDGFPATHDKLRTLKNGGPTFKTVYQNLLGLKKLKSDKLRVSIRINYEASILETIEEFLLKLKTDFEEPRFLIYIIKITVPENKELGIDFISGKEEYIVQEYIFNIYRKMNIGIDSYFGHTNPLDSMCYARRNNVLVIDTNGSIRKCTEYLEDNIKNRIGTIENGIFEVNNELHAQWLYPPQKMLVERGCYDCVDMPLCCGGLCPVHWHRENLLSCGLLHEFTDKMLKIYFERHDNTNKNENVS